MGIFQPATCQKTNMEPENHPFEKENNLLPKLHFGVPAISFFFGGGVSDRLQEDTSRKANCWIAKMMGLAKGESF